MFIEMMRKKIALVTLFFNLLAVYGTTNTKHYIVYMGEHSHPTKDAVVSANHAMLASITGCSEVEAKEAATHHYSRTFRGFSAMLTPKQAILLQESEEVISVFESKKYELHTTYSWDFIGVPLQGSLGGAVRLGSDVIVGSIDTGIWPESESFNDKGLGPVPKRFKGECVLGQNFTRANCNRKIIGARYFFKGYEALNGPLEKANLPFFRSARDADGHGTHTASTVAGVVTPRTSMLGMATGTARGGAPGARIAVYKACWFDYCYEADILSAFDEAIADGVDIISISAGFNAQTSYFHDSIAIGSFHAFRRGILVSASAGNAGGPATAANVAPWILTVGASSIDRKFEAYVRLGNNQVLKGTSLNPSSLKGRHGIVAGRAVAAHGVPAANASYCEKNSLNHELVAGKIVVCLPEAGKPEIKTDKAIVVKAAGGVGMILIDTMGVTIAREYVIPTAVIGSDDAEMLHKYLASKSPVGIITKTRTVLGTTRAPEVAVFSSRGPNIITPDIIKPDITAPGLNILAAWSPVAVGFTADRPLNYFIASGTSMSCPHVSAAAAIVKSRHPGWSPSTIMSALMTTAAVEDNKKKPIRRFTNGTQSTDATPFDLGSGHVYPMAALNPGLVYGFTSGDIIDFLCSKGATPAGLKNLTGVAGKCRTPSHDLNYPSIGVANMKGPTSVQRSVKNVLHGHRVYEVSVESPKGVVVRVVPKRLEFSKYGEKKSFRVEMVPKEKKSKGGFVFGSITWSDGVHQVRSPIGVNVI